MFQKAGDRRGVALCLLRLADLRMREGSHATSRTGFEEALAAFHEIGDKHGIADTLRGLGLLDCASCRFERGVVLSAVSTQLTDEIRSPRLDADQNEIDLALALARKELGDEQFKQLWSQGLSRSADDVVDQVLAREGRTQSARPDENG